MRVMCIDKAPAGSNHPALLSALNKIQVGGIYTVVDETPTMYELAEFPHPWQILWEKWCFIPLTGEDTEIILEEEVLCESLVSEG